MACVCEMSNLDMFEDIDYALASIVINYFKLLPIFIYGFYDDCNVL